MAKYFNYKGMRLNVADMSMFKPEAIYHDTSYYKCPMCGDLIPQEIIGNAEHICPKSRIDKKRAQMAGMSIKEFAIRAKANALQKYGKHLLDLDKNATIEHILNTQCNPISKFKLKKVDALSQKGYHPKVVKLAKKFGDWGL